jgi:hypothetical protein
MPDLPKISDHTRMRMKERGITEQHILNALRRTLPGARAGTGGNIVTLGYAAGQRILKVVLSPDRGTIVTVMWHGDQAG